MKVPHRHLEATGTPNNAFLQGTHPAIHPGRQTFLNALGSGLGPSAQVVMAPSEREGVTVWDLPTPAPLWYTDPATGAREKVFPIGILPWSGKPILRRTAGGQFVGAWDQISEYKGPS